MTPAMTRQEIHNKLQTPLHLLERGDWVFSPGEVFGSGGNENCIFQFDDRIEYSLYFGHEPLFIKIQQ